MEKLSLKAQDIVNKQFSVEFKGYSASEVDNFLDLVLEDYYKAKDIENDFNDKINRLNSEIISLKEELQKEKVRNDMLYSQQKKLQERGTNNLDVLKRLSNLEEKLLGKDE